MAHKILLVEDDMVLAQMYQDKLSANKYDVVVAHTGSEALTKVRGFHPDLVLLDIMLPGGMNGFDVLQQMQMDQLLKTIPVIVFTNLDSEKKVALEMGAKDYIVKADKSLEELLEIVGKHVKKGIF